MRKIALILIIATFVFLMAMLILDPLRIIVFDFILKVIGPNAYNFISGLVNGVITSIGLLGFAGIIGITGLIGGIFVHWGWVKADWSLRRWGSQRIAQDLGAPATTQLPSTPVGATTRPKAQTVASTVAAVTQPTAEDAKKEAGSE